MDIDFDPMISATSSIHIQCLDYIVRSHQHEKRQSKTTSESAP